MGKRWDVFISHASEDKRAVALPLADALRRAGLSVWLDVAELRLGDSLRGKISDGLSNSRFGVVVLSPDFFRKNWPQGELRALMAREEDGRVHAVTDGALELRATIKALRPLAHCEVVSLLQDRVGSDAQEPARRPSDDEAATFARVGLDMLGGPHTLYR